MAVTIRYRKLKDGTTRPYLDIYHKGTRSSEFLSNLTLIEKPRNAYERENNKKVKTLAESIRLNRALELDGNEYEVTAKFKQNIDFKLLYKSFVDNYTKDDIRVHRAVYNKFIEFLDEGEIKLTSSKQVNYDLCYEFNEYLISKLNGETPSSYLSRFKKFLNYCVRKQIFKENPASKIHPKDKNNTLKKNILSIDEIILMKNTPSKNNEVKNAFIFALFTGLRFCDIVTIKFKNIDYINEVITLVQHKTDITVRIPLHPVALEIVKNKKGKDDFVFKLPTNEGTNKMLNQWTQRSGINKKITFHCARHSFATNSLIFDTDLVTLSKLMGQTSTKHTQKYTHIADEMKRKAINNLPNI